MLRCTSYYWKKNPPLPCQISWCLKSISIVLKSTLFLTVVFKWHNDAPCYVNVSPQKCSYGTSSMTSCSIAAYFLRAIRGWIFSRGWALIGAFKGAPRWRWAPIRASGAPSLLAWSWLGPPWMCNIMHKVEVRHHPHQGVHLLQTMLMSVWGGRDMIKTNHCYF